ncbi:MAG: FAD-dependent oxidoreductase [Patescibacteria group bacterium]
MAERYNYLIIGGGIAGTTAAETIRSKDGIGSIALVEAEPNFLYSRVALPDFTAGNIPADKLMLRRLADYESAKIDLYLGERVESLDLGATEARTASGKVFIFSKVLLAGGGYPRFWPQEEGAPSRVARLRTMQDARRMQELIEKYREVEWMNPQLGIEEKRRGKVLVVGGGLNALDLVDIFYNAGFEVTVILRKRRFWEERLDEKGSAIFEDLWKSRGIEIIFESEVKVIADTPDGARVLTDKGDKIIADIVAVGVGLERNLELAKSCALMYGAGIRVNEFMETSRKNVWAVGDAVEYSDLYSGTDKLSGSWSESFMQGKVAGHNMALNEGGEDKRVQFDTVFSYAVTHLKNQIALVGRAEEGANIEAVARFREMQGGYSRFFLKNGIMIGAILLNGQEYLGTVMRLIREKRDLSMHKNNLTSPDFDLSKI